MTRRTEPIPISAALRAARDVIGEVERRANGEAVSLTCSKCRRVRVGPRPDVCRGCAEADARARASAALDRVLLQIPPRFRWARLELEPFAPPGHRRAVCSAEAVRAVRAFRGSLLVLRGETGSAKTSLAAARFISEIERDPRNVVFIECEDIAPDAPDQGRAAALMVRASTARIVVLDDVGADLSGAPAGGGLLSYRSRPVYRLIRALHKASGAGTDPGRLVIITTGLEDEAIKEAYGEDVYRRLTEESESGDTLILRLKGRT